jgi:hypothetical protein
MTSPRRQRKYRASFDELALGKMGERARGGFIQTAHTVRKALAKTAATYDCS